MAPVILWFRQDLRLFDNPALEAALKTGAPIIPLFICEEDDGEKRPLGGASLWWLHHSLSSLGRKISDFGGEMILKKGDALSVLWNLIEETGASGVFWNRRYDAAGISVDKQIKERLKSKGIFCQSSNSHLLFEPWAIANKQGKPFQIFTPFWKTCLTLSPSPLPLVAQRSTIFSQEKIESDLLDDWGWVPTTPDWASGFRDSWQPGEEGAQKRLESFLGKAIYAYQEDRNRPDLSGTSCLSPHLRWGEISPRQIWYAIQACKTGNPFADASIDCFLSELGWREFSYHLLYHFPSLPTEPLRSKFKSFPWEDNPAALECWQKGRTGYPLVDAGMRQLWHTGWMHNRVRMVVASFLVKHLLLPWQVGESWFWDTLVDADLASNSAAWQWVAGSGTDSSPYIRIFNPVLQGEKFDPTGSYIRQWVPELRGLETQWIHQPWMLKTATKKGYPSPVVDHAYARKRAMDAYESLR